MISGGIQWGDTITKVMRVILVLIMLSGIALGREDYAISIDPSGNLAGGSGTGDGWHYYASSGDYVMWFEKGTFDATKVCKLDAYIQVRVFEAGRSVTVDVRLGWATPAWQQTGKSGPPLPDKTGGTTSSPYIDSSKLYSDGPIILGGTSTIEPRDIVTISYNPQWICVIVKARNINMLGFILPYVSEGDSEDDQDGGVQLGACCNQQTGECFVAGTCVNPYVWLGPGTSCSDCKIETKLWDFGDAPSPYPTTMAKNGARHTVKTGIYLGQALSRDADGKPSSGADGDDYDDGVVFTSALVPGQPASFQVTASVNGVLAGWVDFNRDGDWADPGEQVIVDQPISKGATTLSFSVLPTAVKGLTYARFRFCTVGGLSYDGLAQDGEVEDYRVEITSGLSGGGGGTTPNPAVYTPQPPTFGYYPKWSQPSKTVGQALQGWVEGSLYQSGPILADDWQDKDGRPVIGVRWWGCFDNWISTVPPTVQPVAFHIAIWTDGPGSGFPGTLMWETTCTDWSWAFAGYAQDPRGLGLSRSVFEMVHILSQDKWFYPTTVAGSRYWISIAAVYTGTTGVQYPWGILTRAKAYGSAGIRIQTVGSIGSSGLWPPTVGSVCINGLPLSYPANVPWDLSFELISTKSGWGGTSGGVSGSGDVNGDGRVDSSDMAELINILLGAKLFK